MSPTKITLIIYGILMLGGGVMGYAKAGSKMSLIAGILSGIIVFIGIYLTNTNPQLGFSIISMTSIVLAIVFLMRLIKTGKFMPSGMLIILSIIALIISALQLLANKT